MDNKKFNKAIRNIIDNSLDNDEVIEKCADLWLMSDTTQEQDETLDLIKTEAFMDRLRPAFIYYVKGDLND